MEDLATLGIAVDARPVDSAGESLDKFTEKGTKAEAAAKKLVKETQDLAAASNKASSDIDRLVASNTGLAGAVDRAAAAASAGATAQAKLSASLAKSITDAARLIAETQKLASAELNAASAANTSAKAKRDNAAATDDLDARLERLRGSIDPLYAAQSRLDAELKEAAALYKAGSVGAEEYGRMADALGGKLNRVAQLQAKAAQGAKLHGHEMLNLTRQSSDVGVSLAMGMNPLMVMIQQGPQIKETFDMAAARGMNATAVMRQFAAATWAALAPFAPFIAGAAAVAAVIGVGFAAATQQANKATGDLTKGLGLTEKQLKRVKESGESTKITMGDTFGATMKVAGERLYGAFKGPIDAVVGFFGDLYNKAVSGADWMIGFIVGAMNGGAKAIGATWRMIPAAIGDAVISTSNLVVRGIEWLINKSYELVNKLIRGTNNIAGKIGLKEMLSELSPVSIGEMANPFAGAMAELGSAGAKAFSTGLAEGRADWQNFKDDVTEAAKKSAVDRILKAAGDDPATATKAKRSEAEKELEKRIKEAQEFIKALKEETDTLGMNAIAKKQYDIDQAAAIAPTEALTAAIKAQGAALIEKMKAQQITDITDVLEREAAALQLQATLVNATNRERAIALAVLAAEQDLTADKIDLESEGAKKVIALTRQNAAAQADLDDEIGSTLVKLKEVAQVSADYSDRLSDTAANMGDAFGSVGKAMGGVLSIYADLIAKQDEYAVKLEEARKSGNATDATRYAKQMRDAEVGAYGDMIKSAKGFFKEKSLGYKVLEGAEKAYRLFEFAMSAKAITVKLAETAAKLPAYLAEATAAASAGAAKMFAALGPWGFAAVAAMGVTLAAWGFGGGGGGGGASVPTAEENQAAQGTGSVFGDPTAKSESLGNALKIAEQYQNKDLEYSNSMVRVLKNIDNSMDVLAAAVARSLGVGGSLSTNGIGLGLSGRPATLGNLGFGNTTNKTLNDQGINLGSQSLGSILGGGLQGSTFQEVIENTVKKAFGITYSNKTKTKTYTNSLDADTSNEITDVIKSLRDGVLSAAGSLGLEGAQAVLDSFQVNIGKISFKDMTGDEIQEALSAVFGKVGDDMAKAVGGGLVEKFQKVGEGALETLVRLATGIKVFDQQMLGINSVFGLTGIAAIEAKQGVIDLMGGLDDFIDLTNAYAEKFLTDAERLAPVQAAVAAEMARLGYAGLKTKDEFKALVSGIDVTTAAGAALFAALMQVAPAFAQVADAATDLVDSARAALKSAYDRELGALNTQLTAANNRFNTARQNLMSGYANQVAAIQKRVGEAEAKSASARDVLASAYERETSALGGVIDRFKQFSASLRQFRDTLSVGTEAGLSPEEQYRQTKAIFEETAAKAAAGDVDAIAKMASAGSDFLNASRDYYGSAELYQRDLDVVKAAVDQAIKMTDQVVGQAEAQIIRLDQMVGGLLDVNSSVLSVGDAVKSLEESLLAEEEAKKEAKEQIDALNEMLDLMDGVKDGIFTMGDQTFKLVEGVFALDNGLFDMALAINELKLAEAAIANAEAQIKALNALVDPLLNINNSVLSVHDAIAALAAALAAQASVPRDPVIVLPKDPVAPVVVPNDPVAPGVGGGGGYVPNSPGDLQRWLKENGSGPGRPDGSGEVLADRQLWAFANGGIANRPMTVGESGIMAEAGSEGILPLTNIGGKLGVSAKTGTDEETKALLESIRDELAKANVQRGAAANANLESLDTLIEGFDGLKREVARK